jgi:methylisocitrate lyase
MSWLLQGKHEGHAERLKQLVRQARAQAVPGVYDPLSALLARQAGFRALYLSGAALSASLGLPDLGVMTADELVMACRRIVRAADLPVIVDADTGYGERLNVMRLVRELEEAGAAAIQIEDQEMPKKCGHLDGKHLVSRDEMVSRLRAVLTARKSLLVVARTDARGVLGMDEAVARARAYVQEGADLVFPEGLLSEEEFARFRDAVDVPLLANMTEFGKTPHLSVAHFERLGYALVIFPVTALRLAAKAMAGGFAVLRERGTVQDLLPEMLSRRELYDLIEYAAHEGQARLAPETSSGE